MSASLVKALIRKDWHVNRWVVGGYTVGSVLVLMLLTTDSSVMFNAGLILILTLLISLGATLAMGGILAERSEHTLAFIMSLPISSRQYTKAKLISHLSMFSLPWLIILAGTWIITLVRPGVPDGLGLYATVVMAELFINFCVLLGIALVTESSAWSTVGIVATNLILQGCLFGMYYIPKLGTLPQNESLGFSGTVLAVLGGEILVIIAVLGVTLFLQQRKTDFV